MEDNRTRKEMMFGEIGKYCLDISKLVFGGVILAGIMNLDVNYYALFIFGSLSVLLMAVAGFVCINFSNSKRK